MIRAARRAKEAQLEAATRQARVEVQEYANSAERLHEEQLLLQMNRRMAQAEEHNRFLSAQLRTAQQEVQDLTKLNEQVTRLNVIKDERLHEALALIADLEARLQQHQNVRQMVQRAEQQVLSMEQRMEQQALHMQELRNENQQLVHEMQQQTKLVAVTEAKSREAEVAQLRSIIQKLQADVANERHGKLDAEQRNADLLKSIEAERKAHDERRVQYERMQEANDMYRTKNAALEEQARRLHEANNEASFQITRNEARIAELSSVLSRSALLQQRSVHKDALPTFSNSRRPSENGGPRCDHRRANSEMGYAPHGPLSPTNTQAGRAPPVGAYNRSSSLNGAGSSGTGGYAVFAAPVMSPTPARGSPSRLGMQAGESGC
ncbi:hypothetical protein WJX72_002249 [[Myrmecia] bisecta]|uniref:Uncharacterized protein n=1 Tax=[Myrmecia] bisecta TaxID=41462 RepID=A0AAW1NZA4_9CHLO